MGKRMDSSKYYTGGGGNATTGKIYGGGGDDIGKFSVFEFADVDMRVESESRKTLAKFGKRSPRRKFAHDRRAEDKYLFLESFANDSVTPQNYFLQGAGCSSCGAKSPAQRRRQSLGYATGRKHNNVLYVCSDEDELTELRSPTCINLADDEGSKEEQSSGCGKYSKNNDSEAVVAVAPNYVKYGNECYTGCWLTFSQRWIRLVGSPLCDRNISHRLEWSNFDILKIECQQCENVGSDAVNLLLRLKNMNAVETGNSGCVELEFVVLNDPLWSKKQEEIKSLDLQYEAAWKTITSVCSLNESFEDIIYPEGDPDAVFISRGDIELLQPKTFINDTVIDFYIKYLQTKIKEEQHRFYFFNTFFFRKLVDMDQDAHRTWDGADAFQRVRKWTRNVNLFERDYIFMPINYSLHWSLIIICHPGEVANCRDNYMINSSKVPCILHMDSIRGSHRGLENLFKSYLWEEWKERWNNHEEHIAVKFQNMAFFAPQLPQQENLFDCGLFLLHYVELFLEKVSNTSMPNFGFLNEVWFHPAEVSLKKRDQIRNIIYRIIENKAQKYPPAASDGNYLHTGINVGDGSAQSFPENSMKESYSGVKSHSHDDFHEFKGHQRNTNFVTDENCRPDKQLVPISEFSNMWLPMQEGLEGTEIRSRIDEDIKPMSPSSIASGEMKVSQGSPETHGSESLMTCSVQNDVPKVGSSAERATERYEISSASSEDLTTCVVEDSEEEIVMESSSRTTRRSSCVVEDSEEEIVMERSSRTTRRSSFLVSRINLNIGGSH